MTMTHEEAFSLFSGPFLELLFRAQEVHRRCFPINAIQVSTLLSIKTGGCTEDCAYCAQSKCHSARNLEHKPLMAVRDVVDAARKAKDMGSMRFCMGASGRGPKEVDLDVVCEMVREVKKLGLETCVTLGLLKRHQVEKLKLAGLDYYNHNIDTSPEYYSKIISTRTFEDRIHTIELLREFGIRVCCGGILGMGESNEDRVSMLLSLAKMNPPPESVPINWLMRIQGTPLEDAPDVDPFDFVRTIALARILMPSSRIRLAAGRETMSDELQALCFAAGANSLFFGEKLLTTKNPSVGRDEALFRRLGLKKE
jgi:biotin synthase